MVTAAPARPAFFGWRVLGATLVSQALQSGLLIYGFGLIILPFQAEFGANRQTLMYATVLLSLFSNVLSPLVGPLVDKTDIRRLMLLGVWLLAAGFAALSQVRATWQVLLIFALLMPAANLLLGQMTASALVTRWFEQLRGRALGLSAIGTSIGGLAIPPLLAVLAEAFGWRQAYALVAAIILLLGWPIVQWLIIDRPGQIGQRPDGRDVDRVMRPDEMQSRWTTAAVLRAPQFWQIGIVIGLVMAVYMAFLSNIVPHATDQGIAPTRAAGLVSLLALLSIAGKLAFGQLADRIDLRYTLCAAMALMAVGFTLLLTAAATR
jgi:predicted MFS family arabinose efflux permease